MKKIIPAPYKFEFHTAADGATVHQVVYVPARTAMTMLPMYALAQALGGESGVTRHVTPDDSSDDLFGGHAEVRHQTRGTDSPSATTEEA